MPRILLFVQKPYPNDHAVLETVDTRLLPRAGYHPVWVLQPRTPAHNGVRAEWNGTPVYVTRRWVWRGRAARVTRSLELLIEYWRLGRRALREYPADIIQARTGIPEALIGLWLARRQRRPFVFQNSFPREHGHRALFERGPFRWLAGPVYRVDVALLGFIMRRADLTLAISDGMADEWRTRGIQRIVTFPLGADVSVKPEDVTPVEMPPETVIYFGSMGASRKHEFLLDVFSLVLETLPSAHLLMVGEDADGALRAAAQRSGLGAAVTFAGRVPRAEVPRYIRAARCSVALIPPEPMYTISSPTKAVESLAMAVPVVGNREVDDLRQVIEASGGGYAPPYERDALAGALLKLLRDPEDAARRGLAGRAYVEMHRSYDVLAAQLIEHYERIQRAWRH